MSLRQMGVLVVVAAFACGYAQRPKEVKAAVPAACPKFQCKTIHALWTAGNLNVNAYMQVGGAANSDTGVENLFTDTTVEKSPRAAMGNMENWNFPSCNPKCGKDANGKWQAQQEVARAGVGVKGLINPLQREPCTGNGGATGPQADSQSNDNTAGDNPPGLDANGDPIADATVPPPGP